VTPLTISFPNNRRVGRVKRVPPISRPELKPRQHVGWADGRRCEALVGESHRLLTFAMKNEPSSRGADCQSAEKGRSATRPTIALSMQRSISRLSIVGLVSLGPPYRPPLSNVRRIVNPSANQRRINNPSYGIPPRTMPKDGGTRFTRPTLQIPLPYSADGATCFPSCFHPLSTLFPSSIR